MFGMIKTQYPPFHVRSLFSQGRPDVRHWKMIIVNMLWSGLLILITPSISLQDQRRRENAALTVSKRSGAMRAGCNGLDLSLLVGNQL